MPDVDDRLNDAPAGFDHVGALEERRVADHAIAQEALVAGAVFDAEIIAVVEVHVDEAELHHGARNFRAEAERDAFFRLDVNDQAIRFEIFYGGVAEEDEWRAAKLDDDFGGALREALAGAEVEGNAGPAPVVDLEFQRDEGFGVGVGCDVGLAAIAGNMFAVDGAFVVLAADGVGENILGHERLNGVEDFGLFVADFVGVEGDGRLHRGHGEELEEMVGNHVAKGAGGFVEAAAMFDADGFGGGDLHVVDVIAIPERLDDVVREAEDHQVLDGLFAEVVVDAVDLIFGEDLFQIFVELDRGGES